MPAQRLIFLGGTAGCNNWREEFIGRLVERGVPREWFGESVTQRDAALLVFYLGDPKEPGNPLSAFSLVEATVAACKNPDRSLLIFEPAGLEDHARQVYEQTEALLREQCPKLPIFRGTGPALDWIAERFAVASR